MAPHEGVVQMADDYELEESDDLDWLRPPKNLHDAAGWDKYWQRQVAEGVIGFYDWSIHDGPLAKLMVKRSLRTVLCAGNGVSLEAHALSYAGFQVTAADLSAWATEFNRRCRPKPAALRSLLRGPVFFRPVFWGSIYNRCQVLGRLAKNVAKSVLRVKRSGGHVEFLAGDLLDPKFCKGPFDVIIERRTAQLFFGNERNEMLEMLTTRLNPTGILVSHCHVGCWKPGTRPEHLLGPWFEQHGFIVAGSCKDVDGGQQNTAPIALLSLSTG
jgi:hypothetical protein